MNVEDYPLLWLQGNYFNTYKGNTFNLANTPGSYIWAGDVIDYNERSESGIILNSKSLQTNFTATLLGKFKNLNYLDLGDNSITLIDASNLKKLAYVDLRDNLLTSANFAGCTALESLTLRNNNLVSLNCAGLSALTELDAFNNDLTSLTLTGCTALESLTANSNLLPSLDISACVNLEYLLVFNNQLTSLSIASNPKLIDVRVQSNKLNNTAVSQLLVDLDGFGETDGYFRALIFGGGTLTAAAITAKSNLAAKDWLIVGV